MWEESRRGANSSFPLLQLVPLEAGAPEPAVEEEEECLICQDEMGKQKVTQLTCGHVYHKTCIADWLKRKASCPR